MTFPRPLPLTFFRRMFLLFAFVFAATTASAQIREVYSPNDGYLNLRYGPGTQYSIIQKMYNGLRVNLLHRSGNWWKVQLEDGRIGWAYHKYLRKPPAHSYPVLEVYSANDGYLNLRRGASTRYAVIQRMYNGQRVSILEKSGNWYKVRLPNGTIGWAFKRYLVRP